MPVHLDRYLFYLFYQLDYHDLLRRTYNQYQVNAFFVPSEDAHMSEYIADTDKRREWISNFSGSAGHALITEKEALLASQELDNANWKLLKAGQPNVPSWYEYILQNYQAPFKVGIDPKLIAFSEVRKIQDKLKSKSGFDLVPLSNNPIDDIADLPPYPDNEVYVQPMKFAGKTVTQKLSELRNYLTEKDCHSFIVTMLDETAWLFNLRGTDIVYNPLFFSYAVVTQESTTLFVNSARMTSEAHKEMENANVNLKPYEEFYPSLKQLSLDAENENKKILVSDKANWEVVRSIGEKQIDVVRSPIGDAKAIKNEVELQGTREAHARDGIALTQYFGWLEETLKENKAPLKEYDAALKLEEYRSKLDNFKGLSFNTISATGANGAIIHYSPSTTDSSVIDIEKVYLCDSGAQFLDGTTDVTRTYFFGSQPPSDKLKRAFTRVLQGHIALATAVIPTDKVPGPFIDSFARLPLWKEGLEYNHGTGHGIGSHIGAHEGPHTISPRWNDVTLKNGYLVSNEPGYYEEGQFGIRTETIVAIVPHRTPYNYNGTQFSTFETLTMCPLGTNLIEAELLSQSEKDWLNTYHERCVSVLKPELEKRGDTRAIAWLEKNSRSV
ncbi:Creatinase/aminopeptidase [Wallemia mellicola]|nr:Creatinase/aminopeptidase [Wallemia mellicola]